MKVTISVQLLHRCTIEIEKGGGEGGAGGEGEKRKKKQKKQSSCLQLPERKIISYPSFLLLNKM